MSDSLRSPYGIYIDSAVVDSIVHKLAVLQSSISKPPSVTIGLWIPLVASVVGGLLVWTGQAIERNRKRKLDKANNLLEIYAYCRKLEAVMKNHYRELAMAKSHVEYWCHVSNSSSSSMSQQQKGYDEHLRSQTFAREIERKIGDTKAEFIGHVWKFRALKQVSEQVAVDLEVISDLTNAKAKRYDEDIPHEKLRFELFDQDETDLRELYYQNLAPFKRVNTALQLALPG